MTNRQTVKWIGIGLLGLLCLALFSVLLIHLAVNRDLKQTFVVQGESISIPSDEASIEEGRRQAQLRGCFHGCHGREAEGAVMVRLFDGTRVVAPNLGLTAAHYSVEELERVIRLGVKPDGTSVLRIMPSEMLSTLSDEDLGLIIAWMRSLPEDGEVMPESRYGPAARVLGFFFKRKIGSLLAAEVINHDPQLPRFPHSAVPRGRYLADTVCSECHGNDLQGAPDGSAPTLAMVVAYSSEDFGRLMREGIALGERELGLMAAVSRARFTQFTEEELTALFVYLNSVDTWVE